MFEQKMCSISVEPMPSTISRPKRSAKRSKIVGDSASAADTHMRTEANASSASGTRDSAPYSAGTENKTVGRRERRTERIASGFGGPALSTAVAPKGEGEDRVLPRP